MSYRIASYRTIPYNIPSYRITSHDSYDHRLIIMPPYDSYANVVPWKCEIRVHVYIRNLQPTTHNS